MQGDLSVLYALMGVVIFLALMAALGAWLRGGGLKRDEAENLFTDSQERHREEVARLEKIIEETRLATEQAQLRAEETLASRLRELDDHVSRTQSDLQAAVAQAAYDQGVTVSKELESVGVRLEETDKRMSSNITDLTNSLQSVQAQVSQAGDQIRTTLMEITNQQREQKAQSTIQLCEALITSLGTLKSSISNQLIENAGGSARTVEATQTYGELSAPDRSEDESQTENDSSNEEEQYPFNDDNLSTSDTKFTPAGSRSEIVIDENHEGNIQTGHTSDGGEATYNPLTGESTYDSDRVNFNPSDSGNMDASDSIKLDTQEVDQEPRAFNWGEPALSSADEEDDTEKTEEEDANRHA